MSSTPAGKPEKRPGDLIYRGVYKPNPAGTALFVVLRAAEPLVQYSILRYGLGSSLLHKVGLSTLPAGYPNTGTFLDALGLSPYRLILFGMTATAAAKQVGWLLGISKELFPPSNAIAVSLFNGVFNAVTTLLFTCTATSASLASNAVFPQTPLLIGSAMFVAGMAVEIISEVQRKIFKDEPKNKGKLYTGGLWGLSRHVNYMGFAIWRAGFAIASGGYSFGLITLGFFAAEFALHAIPAHEEYLAWKYGAQWEEYKTKTPFKLIPYVY